MTTLRRDEENAYRKCSLPALMCDFDLFTDQLLAHSDGPVIHEDTQLDYSGDLEDEELMSSFEDQASTQEEVNFLANETKFCRKGFSLKFKITVAEFAEKQGNNSLAARKFFVKRSNVIRWRQELPLIKDYYFKAKKIHRNRQRVSGMVCWEGTLPTVECC
ncbi:hypothetical protein RCL1_004472 [Eukaryota sp. TZLM3-RCL]